MTEQVLLNLDERAIQTERVEFRKHYTNPRNLLAFGREVLLYDDLTEETHQELVDITVDNDEALILFPRGHLKSTLITIARSIQNICINPNIRIFISNAVMDMTVKFMREIREHMENNDFLKMLWPEIFYTHPKKESQKWTEDELIVRRQKNLKEATITGGSVEKETTGAHFDEHIYDDLVNKDNCKTADQIEKVYGWWKMSQSLLEPTGRQYIVGTRYDYGDMYGKLLNTSMPRVVRKCWDTVHGERVVLFPKKFNVRSLERIREKQGTFIFSCQYLNEPVDPSTAPFKREYLKYWTSLPSPLNVYVLVDLAISEGRRACETGLLVVGYSEAGDLYVLEDRSGILTPGETLDILYEIDERYGHPAVGIEKMQLEKALRYWMSEYAKQRKKMLNYYELIPDQDKTRRIIANLQPAWEQGRIYLKVGMQELEEQLLRFPRYSMRDRIDTLAYYNQMVFRPTVRQKVTKWTADYGRTFEQRGNVVIKHPWKPRKKVQQAKSFMAY